jgi:outer membrane protein assembly factor BamB
MTIASDGPAAPKQLRLWPGVVAAVLLCLVRYVLPILVPGTGIFAVLGGLVCALAIVLWWVFFSRARWFERLGAVMLMIAAMAGTSRIVDPSIATGMMGMMLLIYAVPTLSLAFVAWAVVTRRLSGGLRRVTMVVTILLACGVWALLRTNGVSGGTGSDLAWRWAKTSEQRLLAQGADEPAVVATALATQPAAVEKGAEWPGFRGPNRDGIIPGVRIATDWSASPPVKLWKRPVGPGWSSFAVRGDLLYTQEQRGSDEVVACYNATTGQPVWKHRDAARFWESNAGPGPRGTPTLGNGRVYTFGATGILNVLDAANGAVVWSRNAATDTGKKIPQWGFASSPLVVGDAVIVAVAGRLAGYDLATGKPRWLGPDGGGSYSSPHFLTVGGVPQVVLVSDAGATSVAPADGSVLWKHAWPGFAILQPALTADGGVLIATSMAGGGLGTRLLAVAHGSGGWTAEERWTSIGMKPYFNDFVVHNRHAFGFDGDILVCIDMKDGKRQWKGGRYGNGQLVLLSDQDLLLVLTEEGELALVGATADKFRELARVPAIEGKTWNHPVLAGNVLLVRNGEEMAAFRLPLARR